MMKGGRQAKLLAKENQAKKRAEKIYASFKKDSLKKLKDRILPSEAQTPGAELQTGHNFSEKAEATEKASFSKTFTKNLKRKGTLKTKARDHPEHDVVKERFMSLFSEELEKRKNDYYQAKEKKDEAFREIERLKTSYRMTENRLKKKNSTTSGVSYPIKIEIGVTEADLDQNRFAIIGALDPEDLKIFYRINTSSKSGGTEKFESAKVGDVLKPTWADAFEMEFHNSKQKIFFEIVTRLNGVKKDIKGDLGIWEELKLF